MAITSPLPPSPDHTSAAPKRFSIGFLTSLMVNCANRASRVSSKLKTTAATKDNQHGHRRGVHLHLQDGEKSPSFTPSPKSLLVRPKQLVAQISNKAITFINSKKRASEENDVVAPDVFGDGGVWQKAILMGDKCQPLDFSGVIYYDSTGKLLNEIPLRSPRASPLPGHRTRAKQQT